MDYYADRRRRPLNNCNSGANGYLTCQCQCGTLLSIFTTTTERATHYATTLIVTQLVELTYASQSDFPADVHSPCRGKICNHQGEGVPRVGIEIAGSICICRRTKVCAGWGWPFSFGTLGSMAMQELSRAWCQCLVIAQQRINNQQLNLDASSSSHTLPTSSLIYRQNTNEVQESYPKIIFSRWQNNDDHKSWTNHHVSVDEIDIYLRPTNDSFGDLQFANTKVPDITANSSHFSITRSNPPAQQFNQSTPNFFDTWQNKR